MFSSAGFAGLVAPVSIARCTSSFVTRPPGPVPASDSASMLCRSASRCATGVTRDPEGLSAVELLGCSTVLAGVSCAAFAGAAPPESMARLHILLSHPSARSGAGERFGVYPQVPLRRGRPQPSSPPDIVAIATISSTADSTSRLDQRLFWAMWRRGGGDQTPSGTSFRP